MLISEGQTYEAIIVPTTVEFATAFPSRIVLLGPPVAVSQAELLDAWLKL